MLVLDASVLIAHLDASDEHHERAAVLLLASADLPLAVSPLTRAEVLVGPARAGQLAQAIAALGRLAVNDVPLDAGGPERLAVLRARTKLRLPDCCVLLAAEQTLAAIATFDDRLAAAAASLGIVVATA